MGHRRRGGRERTLEPRKFHPVWVSSVEHLRTFNDVIDSASLVERLTGSYKIPSSFPRLGLRRPFLGVACMPIVYFAEGTLTLGPGLIDYAAETPHRPRASYEGIDVTLTFQLGAGAIQSLDRYHYPLSEKSRLRRYYNIDWIHLTVSEPILSSDFLLCVGGPGPSMNKSRRATDEMYEALSQAVGAFSR